MELEFDPPQADPVAEAVATLLADDAPDRDPWWAAGIEEALRT